MTGTGDKQEPPLPIDMDFSEALERFARTKPAEVAAGIERANTKKPPGEKLPRRPAPTNRTRKPAGGT